MKPLCSTRSAKYVDPNYLAQHPSLVSTRYHKTLSAKGLEEHKVLDEIEREFYPFRNLSCNPADKDWKKGIAKIDTC